MLRLNYSRPAALLFVATLSFAPLSQSFSQDKQKAGAAVEAEAAPSVEPEADSKEDKDSIEKELKEREAAFKKVETFGWTREGTANVGNNATIKLSPGLRLTDGKGAAKLLSFFDNIPSGKDVAILGSEDLSWWATFSFVNEGYVKDDEKDSIDADALLKQQRANQEESNKERISRGLAPYELRGWAVKPFYNQETKSLEYGILLADVGAPKGAESVNYSTNILGRRGYMEVTLVTSVPLLQESLASLRESLKSFQYNSGETYAEYRSGDKVAQYGLTALIGGGALAVAAKTGLLAKLWKPIAIGIAALFGGIKKLFGKKQA